MTGVLSPENQGGVCVDGGGMYCSGGTCSVWCDIDSVLIAPDAGNPQSPCEVCDPSNPTAWSNRAEGAVCAAGNVCTSNGTCQPGCFIDGTVYPPNAAEPMTPCGYCNVGNPLAWSSYSDGTFCGSSPPQYCLSGVCTAGCFIDNTFYDVDAGNPANSCQVCGSAAGGTFSNEANGTACDAGVCLGGSCQSGCWVASIGSGSPSFQPAGTTANNGCLQCVPTTATQAWSVTTEVVCAGDACGGEQVCTGAGACVNSSTPSLDCDAGSCQVGTCVDADGGECNFTVLADGTSCDAGACHSGACLPGCGIGGSYFALDSGNPDNTCQVCTSSDTTNWTNRADGSHCGPADAGGLFCSSGVCSGSCTLSDGGVFDGGTLNPANPCEICNPGLSVNGFSKLSTGTVCDAGDVCDNDSCKSGCFIGGTYYAPGTGNPGNVCQSCNPAVAITAWTNLANGDLCGSGAVCFNGVCDPGCFIDAGFFTPNTVNPTNDCQECATGTSTSTWSDVATGTLCDAGAVCNGGSCQAGCFVPTPPPAGPPAFQAPGTFSDAGCLECEPSLSVTSWSDANGGDYCAGYNCSGVDTCQSGACVETVPPLSCDGGPCEAASCPATSDVCDYNPVPDGTTCQGSEVCSSGDCVTGCFISNTYEPVDQINPANPCQVCAASGDTSWTTLANGTTCVEGGGLICVNNSCVADCQVGTSDYPAGELNPANPCEVCTPSQSTSAFTQLATGSACNGSAVCIADVCTPGCYIAGTFEAPDAGEPSNLCAQCNPTLSVSGWSTDANRTYCGLNMWCQSGSCTSSICVWDVDTFGDGCTWGP